MSNTIKWEVELVGDNAIVDNQYFILKEDLNWAQDWDEVEIELNKIVLKLKK